MDILSLKLFMTLLFVLQLLYLQAVHGRENFSKFTHVVDKQMNEKTNNNNNVNETVVPNKVDPLNKQNQDDQDPTFIPETQNGYGLYGRGNSPTEKTTSYTEDNNDNDNDNHNNNNNNNNYDDEYENGVQEDMITDTSLMGSGYTTPMSSKGYQNGENNEEQGNQRQYNNGETMYSSEEELDNSNVYNKRYNSNDRYNNGGNRYNSNQYNTGNKYHYDQQYYNGANKYNDDQQQNYYNAANKYNNEQQNYNGANKHNYNGENKYNVEKQGISDTRFLENGRYFHDLNNEKNNYRRDYNNEQYVSNKENAYEFDRYEFDRSGDKYKYQYP